LQNITENIRGAVGFCLSGHLGTEAEGRMMASINGALVYFPWLKRERLTHGTAILELWSHHDVKSSVYSSDSGELFVLVGSPMNTVPWVDVSENLGRRGDDAFELSWEGRCILIRLSPDGQEWTLWNDWCGSIPVFHTSVQGVPVASSLEPAVVAAADFTPDHFSKHGVVEMLVHGHFLGTETLFDEMQTLQPDSLSRWQDGKFAGSTIRWTVEPTDSRWDKGWGKLADELHEYTLKAVGTALKQHDTWILPLSGGIDSRLVACVGAEQDTDFKAYTYGPATWCEPVYARQVACALNIPWQRVDVGVDYLADYTPMWLNWFGSSLHAHGMYQMPFLRAVKPFNAPIVQGFIGDPIAGNHLRVLDKAGSNPYQHLSNFSTMWSAEELPAVLNFDPAPVVSEISEMVLTQYDMLRGVRYQRLMFLDFWNRQRNFIFYQPMMYDYWKGVATPFMDREYARFCLSLPRLALEGRRLQMEMLKRYWPEASRIAGTYSYSPLVMTKRYLARRAAAYLLPRKLRVGPLREFNTTPNNMDPDCVLATGDDALYPLPDKVGEMAQTIFRREGILYAIEEARKGTWHGYEMCQALMPVARRI